MDVAFFPSLSRVSCRRRSLLTSAVPAAWARAARNPPRRRPKWIRRQKPFWIKWPRRIRGSSLFRQDFCRSPPQTIRHKSKPSRFHSRDPAGPEPLSPMRPAHWKKLSRTASICIFFLPHDNQYVKQPTPAEDAIPAVLSQARGTLLPTLAGSPEVPVTPFLAAGRGLTSGNAGNDCGPFQPILSPRSCPVAAQIQIQIRFSVATEDHLLRRLTETARLTQGRTNPDLHPYRDSDRRRRRMPC